MGSRATHLEILSHTVPEINALEVGIVAIIESPSVIFKLVRKLKWWVSKRGRRKEIVRHVRTTRFMVLPFFDVLVLTEEGVAGSIKPVLTFFNKETLSLMQSGSELQPLVLVWVYRWTKVLWWWLLAKAVNTWQEAQRTGWDNR